MNINILAIPALFISIFFLYYHWRLARRLSSPGIVFNGLWAAVILLNQINYNHFYGVSEYTYLILLIGILCFNVGFLAVKTRRNYDIDFAVAIDSVDINSRKLKLFYGLQVFVFVSLLPLTAKSVAFHALYGNAAFRTVYANGIEFGYMNVMERMFYIHYGIFPLNLALICVGFVLWSRKIIKVKHMALSIVNLALIFYDSGNRGDILILMIFLLFAVDLSQTMRNELGNFFQSKQVRIISKFLFVLGAGGLILASIIRGNYGKDSLFTEIMKLVTTNFSGGINLLDLALQSPKEWGLGQYMGGASVSGFLGLIFLAIRIVSFGKINIEMASPTAYAAQFFNVSPEIKMNAYTTAFYTFLEDFGLMGVIVLSFIWGAIAMHLYKKCLMYPTIRNTGMCILSLYVILFTSVTWQLTASHVAALFVHVWWISTLIETKKNISIRI